jgi:8-oxo-dGTP diphosphatase
MITVAVALIINEQEQVLISQRQQHQHQGGKWEFPGGKCEANESVFDALVREIHEEVGLSITDAEAFMSIEHDYGDKQVRLEVYKVTQFSGQAESREGQRVEWVPVVELRQRQFPDANVAIIDRLISPA